METLLETLKQDCRDWIFSNTEVFLSEHDMQMKLSRYLWKAEHYDWVDVEYAVPMASLKAVAENHAKAPIVFGKDAESFPWNAQMFIDLVVEKDEEFAAVELKYATTTLDKYPKPNPNQAQKRTVFGQDDLVNVIKHIKHKGAHDIVQYGYWKDVRRIEALTRFKNVVGGVALIVSNDSAYWGDVNNDAGSAQFSTHPGDTKSGKLKWVGCEKTQVGRPPFSLNGSYECKWEKMSIPYLALEGKNKRKSLNDRKFHYMMSVISKADIEQQIQKSK